MINNYLFTLNQIKSIMYKGPHIFIALCNNCQQNQWCSIHSSNNYLYSFNESIKSQLVKQCIEKRFNLEVIKNPPFLVSKIRNSGSFEMYFENILIFSKNQSNSWPKNEQIMTIIEQLKQQYEKDQNLTIYKNQLLIFKNQPSKKLDQNANKKSKIVIPVTCPYHHYKRENQQFGTYTQYNIKFLQKQRRIQIQKNHLMLQIEKLRHFKQKYQECKEKKLRLKELQKQELDLITKSLQKFNFQPKYIEKCKHLNSNSIKYIKKVLQNRKKQHILFRIDQAQQNNQSKQFNFKNKKLQNVLDAYISNKDLRNKLSRMRNKSPSDQQMKIINKQEEEKYFQKKLSHNSSYLDYNYQKNQKSDHKQKNKNKSLRQITQDNNKHHNDENNIHYQKSTSKKSKDNQKQSKEFKKSKKKINKQNSGEKNMQPNKQDKFRLNPLVRINKLLNNKQNKKENDQQIQTSYDRYYKKSRALGSGFKQRYQQNSKEQKQQKNQNKLKLPSATGFQHKNKMKNLFNKKKKKNQNLNKNKMIEEYNNNTSKNNSLQKNNNYNQNKSLDKNKQHNKTNSSNLQNTYSDRLQSQKLFNPNSQKVLKILNEQQNQLKKISDRNKYQQSQNNRQLSQRKYLQKNISQKQLKFQKLNTNPDNKYNNNNLNNYKNKEDDNKNINQNNKFDNKKKQFDNQNKEYDSKNINQNNKFDNKKKQFDNQKKEYDNKNIKQNNKNDKFDNSSVNQKNKNKNIYNNDNIIDQNSHQTEDKHQNINQMYLFQQSRFDFPDIMQGINDKTQIKRARILPYLLNVPVQQKNRIIDFFDKITFNNFNVFLNQNLEFKKNQIQNVVCEFLRAVLIIISISQEFIYRIFQNNGKDVSGYIGLWICIQKYWKLQIINVQQLRRYKKHIWLNAIYLALKKNINQIQKRNIVDFYQMITGIPGKQWILENQQSKIFKLLEMSQDEKKLQIREFESFYTFEKLQSKHINPLKINQITQYQCPNGVEKIIRLKEMHKNEFWMSWKNYIQEFRNIIIINASTSYFYTSEKINISCQAKKNIFFFYIRIKQPGIGIISLDLFQKYQSQEQKYKFCNKNQLKVYKEVQRNKFIFEGKIKGSKQIYFIKKFSKANYLIFAQINQNSIYRLSCNCQSVITMKCGQWLQFNKIGYEHQQVVFIPVFKQINISEKLKSKRSTLQKNQIMTNNSIIKKNQIKQLEESKILKKISQFAYEQ